MLHIFRRNVIGTRRLPLEQIAQLFNAYRAADKYAYCSVRSAFMSSLCSSLLFAVVLTYLSCGASMCPKRCWTSCSSPFRARSLCLRRRRISFGSSYDLCRLMASLAVSSLGFRPPLLLFGSRRTSLREEAPCWLLRLREVALLCLLVAPRRLRCFLSTLPPLRATHPPILISMVNQRAIAARIFKASF